MPTNSKKPVKMLHMLVPVETIVSLRAPLRRSLASFFASFLRPFLRLLPTSYHQPLDSFSDSSSCVLFTRINLSAWTTDTQHSRSASIFLLLSSSICSRVERGKLLLFTDSTFLAFLELEWRLWTTRMVATESFLSSAIFCLFVLWEERIFGSIVFRNAYARLNLG